MRLQHTFCHQTADKSREASDALVAALEAYNGANAEAKNIVSYVLENKNLCNVYIAIAHCHHAEVFLLHSLTRCRRECPICRDYG